MIARRVPAPDRAAVVKQVREALERRFPDTTFRISAKPHGERSEIEIFWDNETKHPHGLRLLAEHGFIGIVDLIVSAAIIGGVVFFAPAVENAFHRAQEQTQTYLKSDGQAGSPNMQDVHSLEYVRLHPEQVMRQLLDEIMPSN